jgi:hypothetical protein
VCVGRNVLQLHPLQQRAELWALVELRGPEQKYSRLSHDATGGAGRLLDGEGELSVLRHKRALVLAMLQDF